MGPLTSSLQQRKSGYTFLEILIAIGILSFIASFVVPTFELLLAQLQLSTAASQVEELLRLNQQKTVTQQVLYGVTLTSGASTIPQYIYNTTTGSKTAQDTYTLPSNIQVDSVNFSGVADVRFSTSGAPNVSGDLVLIDTVRNRRRRVEVRPSGAVLANQAEF